MLNPVTDIWNDHVASKLAGPSAAAPADDLRLELARKQATIDALIQGFLPIDFPVVDGLTFDVLYRPAAVIENLGGDWYDVFALRDGRIAFSLGDVCGKGLGSAVKMGQAKQAIKVAASLRGNDPMPLAVLTQANQVIFLNDNDVTFTTAIYGVIDVANRKVTYACAGHPPPMLAQPDRAAQLMPNHGFALGVEPDMPDLIREHEFRCDPGSLLVVYTDGIVEFEHDPERGEASLLQAASKAVASGAKRPASFIVDDVLQGQPRYADDIAVLTIRFT